MSEKLFYSFFLEEGQSTYSIPNYQIVIKASELSTGIDTGSQSEHYAVGRGLYITRSHYEHLFLKNFFRTDPVEIESFLDYHLSEYSGDSRNFIKRIDLLFSRNNFPILRKLYSIKKARSVHHYQIEDHLYEVRKWIDKNTTDTPISKLIWNGTPSQFGHIFYELADKGFIEAPKWRGEINKTQYANICWGLFEFKSKSIENLAKELSSDDNSLTYANKELFQIPHLKDLS